MDDMQDYRIAEWVENGLLKRIINRCSAVAVVAAVVLGSVAGIGSSSASNLSPTANRPSHVNPDIAMTQLQALVSSVPSMIRLKELRHLIEEASASLDSANTSDIDPHLLALADEALSRIDARQAAHG